MSPLSHGNAWWRTHSVRVSLTAWYVGAMVVVLGLYASAVFVFVSRNLSEHLDELVRSDSQWAATMADQGPDGTLRWFDNDANGEGPWLQVWSGGALIFRTANAERNPYAESAALAARADQQIVTISGSRAPVRILSTPSQVYGRKVVIQVAQSEGPMRRQRNQLLAFLVLGLPLGVAAAGIGGYSLARRALAPIETMADRARTITAQRLSDRLPVHNPNDELGRLASVFNELLGRLESSFEQMRRFTADVSHELRTPLTAMRSVGEVGLRERRDAEAYRGIIGSMLEEVGRLSTLVDRLLTLSRAEIGQVKLSRDVVDLRGLAEEAVAQLGVLAEEKRQTMTVEPGGSPRGLGDRAVLRQSLMNLVDNAIKYSPAGAQIRLRVWESPTSAVLDVIDNGPGIAPDVRARVFDRFYRAGSSRTSERVAGTGLGLSIAKWAVEANGGQLSLESTGGGGSTFRIAVPRAQAARPVEGRRTA